MKEVVWSRGILLLEGGGGGILLLEGGGMREPWGSLTEMRHPENMMKVCSMALLLHDASLFQAAHVCSLV